MTRPKVIAVADKMRWICELWRGKHYWRNDIGRRSAFEAGISASEHPVGAVLVVDAYVYVNEVVP